MRIIDIDRGAVTGPRHQFEPAGRPLERFQRGEDRVGRIIEAERHACRHERIEGLKEAGQRQGHRALSPLDEQPQALSRCMRELLDQAQAGAFGAHRDEAQAPPPRRRNESLGVRRVGVDGGDATLFHERIEQAQLGGKIIVEADVIIEMVPGDISESRGRNPDAVKAELIEPMARRFERKILHALLPEARELAMQAHRIGRRMRERAMPGRAVDPDGAEARGFAPLRRPDLTQEGSDRSLAVGAGDCGDACRLGAAIELGRELRETAARIGGRKETHAERANLFGRLRARKNRHRPPSHRLLDETGAVRPGARKRREQESGLDLPTVGRQSTELLDPVRHGCSHFHVTQHSPQIVVPL